MYLYRGESSGILISWGRVDGVIHGGEMTGGWLMK